MAIYNIFDYYEKESHDKVAKQASGPLQSGGRITESRMAEPRLAEQLAPSMEHTGPSINPDAFHEGFSEKHFLPSENPTKGHFFSALAARFFFFLLLIADLAWAIYTTVALVLKGILTILTFARVAPITRSLARTYLNFKRAIVCAIALFTALFSPALGIMFSCMYFLMYDKSGVDEVVPASLRDQFHSLFPAASC